MNTQNPALQPAPPQAEPTFTPKKPPKLLYAFIGLAVILFSVALAIVFFGNKGSSPSTSQGSNGESVAEQVDGWPKYANPDFFYELSIPPKWVEIKHSPIHPEFSLFNALDTATLEIRAEKNILSLDEYLAKQDAENKNIVNPTKSTQVKVGDYEAYEREESWPKSALQGITTYTKVSDMLYIFTLSPAGTKNAVTNQSILRDYRTALASFRLTDTSKLGLDLKEYNSPKVDGSSFKLFSLKYPQTWVAREEFVGGDTVIVSIYRNNYEIRITQAPVGTAVCLFSDSPDFQGSSGDLRNKQFTEFNTADGVTMRRYFNANEGEKSSLFFCRKEASGPYFSTPTDFGGIAYYVPAKFDDFIIKEMDEIVKSITPVDATSSATTQ